MGGQACVFYGAAEFSRDLDLLVLLDPHNIENIQHALQDLKAERIAVTLGGELQLAAGFSPLLLRV